MFCKNERNGSSQELITQLFYQIEAMMVIPYYHDYGKDVRLYCVEDSPQRVFWTYWGDMAFDTPPMERCASGVSNCKRTPPCWSRAQ